MKEQMNMKKLNIDLELLFQSLSFDDDTLGSEYLDTETGDIMNIPYEVTKVVKGEIDEEALADWQKELLKDAYTIEEDSEDRYIMIPNIDDSFFYDAMVQFSEYEVESEILGEKLLDALNGRNPMRNFKNVICQYPEELDKWYAYEDQKAKEYVIDWLRGEGIELE